MSETENPVSTELCSPQKTVSRPKTAATLRFQKSNKNSNLLDHLPPAKPSTAYKRYNSVLPSSSKLLSYHWDAITLQKHKDKIKTMKACIDNQAASRIDPQLRSLKQQVTKKGAKYPNYR
jgi:hypothetical protein